MVDEPVDGGERHGGIGKDPVPLTKWLICSNRRQGLRRQRHPRPDRGPRRGAKHPRQVEPQVATLLLEDALPRAQSGRALLQQAQALPTYRYPLRQARRQLPRYGQTRLNAPVAPRL